MSPSFCRNPEGDVPTPHIQYCSDDPPHNCRLSDRVWISYSDVTVRSKDMAAVSTQVSTQVSTSTVSTRHVTVGQLRGPGFVAWSSWSSCQLVRSCQVSKFSVARGYLVFFYFGLRPQKSKPQIQFQLYPG